MGISRRDAILGSSAGVLTLAGPRAIDWIWGWLSPKRNPPQVVLNWTPSVSTDVTGYRIYRGPTATGPFELIANLVGKDINTFTDMGVRRGQVYYYVATAYNSAGESDRSNQAMATIPRYAQ
jgi:fibronectin type 3 domain-containing protein